MEEKNVVIYRTKYALGHGVIKEMAVLEKVNYGKHDHTTAKVDGYSDRFFEKEYCLTEEEALERFEEMKSKKIASLKKQIARVEKLKPTIVDHTKPKE